MAPKKAPKKVRFSKKGGELRTEEVRPEGYEPFSITFAVPDAASNLNMGFDGQAESRGMAMVKYVDAHLDNWTLEQEPTLDSLLSIEDADILWELFNIIYQSRQDRKN